MKTTTRGIYAQYTVTKGRNRSANNFSKMEPSRVKFTQQVYVAGAVCYPCHMALRSSKSMPHHSNNFAVAGPKERDPGLITSRDNKWVKLFRSLLQGSGSAERDLIGIEGPKLVEEALRSGLEAEALLVSATGEREIARILAASCESDTGIRRERIFRTSDKIFATLTGTETPQGVAALFRQPVWGLEDVLRGRSTRTGTFSGDSPLVVVLTGVQDPGNTGTILRSAEALGPPARLPLAEPAIPGRLKRSVPPQDRHYGCHFCVDYRRRFYSRS